MRIWLNGEILDADAARISPFDRGFLFGDGVYETVAYFNRVGVGVDLHVQRLRRSMDAIGIDGFDAGELDSIAQRLLDEADLENAIYYLQVTRGVQMPRRHLPPRAISPTVFAYVVPSESLADMRHVRGIRAATRPDERWHRCTIKGVSLLGNLLALMEGQPASSAEEVILHRDGVVTEGSMTTVFLVSNRDLITPLEDGRILPGVTRRLLLECADQLSIAVAERDVPVAELSRADEIFVASSRRILDAVVNLDGRPVGGGAPGPIARALFADMRERLAHRCSVARQVPIRD